MKITICGSMKFAKEMLEAKKVLEEMGHTVHVAKDTEHCVGNSGLAQDVEWCAQNNVMQYHFGLIEKSDAVLVLNYHKNGIDGYVGPNTLIDMGVAHFLGKKIFLLNNIPEIGSKVEIQLMNPFLLGGDLNKLEAAE